MLVAAIVDNAMKNTGFLIWLSNHSLACVIQNQDHSKSKQTKYFILSSNEGCELNLLKPFTDPLLRVGRFCDILHLTDPDIKEVDYLIRFLSCQSTLTKSEKQKILQKLRYTEQKKYYVKLGEKDISIWILYTRKPFAIKMDLDRKNKLFQKNQLKHKKMDPVEKRACNKKNG